MNQPYHQPPSYIQAEVVHGPPPPFHGPPPFPPPAAPRKRGWVKWVVMGVVSVLLLCAAGIAVPVVLLVRDARDWPRLDGQPSASADLELVKQVRLPAGATTAGDKAVGATTDGDTLFYAYGLSSQTEIHAVALTGKGVSWTVKIETRPRTVRLTRVADLLLVEVAGPPTGRAGQALEVLSARDGSSKWRQSWGGLQRRYTALSDTEITLVTGVEKPGERTTYQVQRLDLATGTPRWTADLGRQIFRHAVPVRLWPDGKAPSARPFQFVSDELGGDRLRRRTSAGADPDTTVTMLSDGTVQVFDGAGKVRVSKKFSPEPDEIIAFAGTLVGYVRQLRSIVGWDLATLDVKWQAPYQATSLEQCGATKVCAHAGEAGGGATRIVPIDVVTGEEHPASTTIPVTPAGALPFSAYDYTPVDGYVVGTSITETAVVRNVAPWDIRRITMDGGDNVNAIAVAGHTAVLEGGIRDGQWRQFVIDLRTFSYTRAVPVGRELPVGADVVGDLVVLMTGDDRVVVYRNPL